MSDTSRDAYTGLYSETYIEKSLLILNVNLRVIVVESHAIVRRSLQCLMSNFTQIEVVSCVKNGQEALHVINDREVDIVVFGTSTSLSECLYCVEKLGAKGHCCNMGIILIQVEFIVETVSSLIRGGIHCLLDEFALEQDLVSAFQAAAKGNTFLSRHTRELLARSMSVAPLELTLRELQVLSLLISGEPNRRIACVLGLKEKTVETYLSRIYEKLGVHSRTEAIVYWSANLRTSASMHKLT